MKSKKFAFSIVAVILLAAMVVTPALAQGEQPPVPQSAVELPLELQALIAGGIGFLVTAGLKSLSTLLKKDISGWGAVITGGLVTSVVYFANALLSAVPVEAQQPVSIALTLLVSILSAFGVARTVKSWQPK